MPTTSEDRLEELRRKYAPALREMEQQHVSLIQLLYQNEKLYVHGATQSQQALKRIQSRLADIDPDWSREVDLDLRSPGVEASHTGQNVVNHAEDFEQAADDTGESA
jgi:hypothetical protein